MYTFYLALEKLKIMYYEFILCDSPPLSYIPVCVTLKAKLKHLFIYFIYTIYILPYFGKRKQVHFLCFGENEKNVKYVGLACRN